MEEGRESMSGDKRIPPDQLMVGDVIGVREAVSVGWKHFRHPITVPRTIKRITPKRTKIITDDGREYNVNRTWFYVIDEETKRINKVALCAAKINRSLYCLEKSRSDGTLFSASDDGIVAASSLLDEVCAILCGEEKP